jgi:thiol-disulfide isomerase/thioredoxin
LFFFGMNNMNRWGAKPVVLALAVAWSFKAWATAPAPTSTPASAASHAAVAPSANLPWHVVQSEAQIDAVLAKAKADGRPVFLYWGAVWCPPCNHVKATLFSRSDFAEVAKGFEAVFVDGDRPGAQKISSRFKVRGYPSMLVFNTAGEEISRLPGEADPQRYLQALSGSMASAVTVAELVAQALQGPKTSALAPSHWQALANYAWDVDEGQSSAKLKAGNTPAANILAALFERAKASADVPIAVLDRLALKAMSMGTQAQTDWPAAQREALRSHAAAALLSEPRTAALRDLLAYQPWGLVDQACGGDQAASCAQNVKASLQAQFLATQQTAPTVAADALDAIIELNLGTAKHPLGLLEGKSRSEFVTQAAARLQALAQVSKDRYVRQALVPSIASSLAKMGDIAASNALLEAELGTSVAPYYHMLVLASNAKKQGEKAQAVQWYQRAWQTSTGPATRIQWGTSYLTNLMDLAPDDQKTIERDAKVLLTEAIASNDALNGRNFRSLERVAAKVQTWAKTNAQHASTAQALQAQWQDGCARTAAADKATCNTLRFALQS